MRLDLYLKASRLILRRSLAQKFCDAGLVQVNGTTAKSSREIRAQDELKITRGNRILKIKVVEVPEKKQVSRQDAALLYEIISEEQLPSDPAGI